jgi:MSHA pilin protein MshC
MQAHSIKQSGFTLIELIMVIILIAILSAVALPRFFNRSSFETRAFFDDTLNAVRFAQKHAVASGCNVRVNFTTNGYQLLHADSCGASTYANSLAVKQPNSSSAYAASDSTITLTAISSSTSFDALGQADADNQVTLGGRTISIIATTGFVYDSTP